MSQPSIAEFAQYRFVRDASGNVVSLPSQLSDEKILLVLDCERWGFARLHIFEGAAVRAEKLEAFEEEMGRVSALRTPLVSRIISWGRDGEELFYADEMRDGEPLPAYLARAGKVPMAMASSWILEFIDLFTSIEPLPASMERLTTLNFEVVRDRNGGVRPVFSEFTGWTKPGAHVREHRLEWSLAQIFCSLIAGVPIRNFHRDSLPRNFEELPPRTREAILDVFSEDGRDLLATFREVMRQGAGDPASSVEGEAAQPLMPLREWLRCELDAAEGPGDDQHLSETLAPGDEPYAIVSRVRGAAAHLQVLPGPETLPREGWLNQHHDITRRPGRGMVHQLQVNYLEDLPSVTLVGEEQVAGLDLATLLDRVGPLSFEQTAGIGMRINAALDALEKQTGACSVWWLPPGNVLLLTGTRSLSSSVALLERKGGEAWRELPLKLRLHQTVTSLMEGVDLPAAVRECSRLPGRQFEAARRSAIALPLLWHLLTGARFRWTTPSEHSLVPVGVSGKFEEFRQLLRDDPESITTNFFHVFTQLDPDEPIPAETSVSAASTTMDGVEKDSDPVPGVVEEMEDRLYEGELELPPGSEVAEGGSAFQDDGRFDAGAAAGFESGRGEDRRMPWGWIVVAAVVMALLVGFSLSGWAQKLGLFEEAQPLTFAFPEFRVEGAQRFEEARGALGEYLISEGSPQSLRLLPLLDHLDPDTSRREIEPWLRHLVAKGDVAAARVMGLLTLALGESNDTAAGWFLEGARKGDAEAGFHYATLRWSETAQSLEDPEAVDFLRRAADSGHPPSQDLLGRYLYTANDLSGARAMWDRASAQGWVPAIYAVGLCHATGTGCSVDSGLAVASFRAAAEQGDARAMYDFGRCLSVGWGVSPSFPESLRWIKLASARGHGGALRWLLDRNIDPEN